MFKIQNLLGKRTWVGLTVIFLISLIINAVCSILLVKGVLAESVADHCVYVAWGIGGVIGSFVASKGKDGTLLRGVLMAVIAFGLTWLLGFLIFGSVSFGGYALGTAISLTAGCIFGGFFPGKKSRKRHVNAGKGKRRRNGKR